MLSINDPYIKSDLEKTSEQLVFECFAQDLANPLMPVAETKVEFLYSNFKESHELLKKMLMKRLERDDAPIIVTLLLQYFPKTKEKALPFLLKKPEHAFCFLRYADNTDPRICDVIHKILRDKPKFITPCDAYTMRNAIKRMPSYLKLLFAENIAQTYNLDDYHAEHPLYDVIGEIDVILKCDIVFKTTQKKKMYLPTQPCPICNLEAFQPITTGCRKNHMGCAQCVLPHSLCPICNTYINIEKRTPCDIQMMD